ncbi:hypothetical protein Gpo141_00005872 [Globisporangium polare]
MADAAILIETAAPLKDDAGVQVAPKEHDNQREDDGGDDNTDDDELHEQVHNNNNNTNATDMDKKKKKGSFRILGTFASHQIEQSNNDNDNGEEEDDPMAWADLEEFGGTKKTLEKKKPLRKLTPEEVREQLQELHEIERLMEDTQRHKKPKQGMIDTIEWLKKHNEAVEAAAGSNQKKVERSSSFVKSVLGFFSSGSRSRNGSRNEDDPTPPTSATAGGIPNSNNLELSSSLFDEEYEHFAKLTAPWGQRELKCDWTRVGFGLLNQSILYDIERVRAVITKGELGSATPQAIIAVAKWLTLFDQHVHDVITLKEYLLEERTVIAGVGYKVTTIYDSYSDALNTALEKVHEDKRYLGDAIEHAFSELEAILKDEVLAVEEVISQSLTEEQEYEALSCLFHHLSDEEGCGVIVAKLLGWMKLHMDEADVKAFLAIFDHDMQDKLAGEWMRHYASYLHLLDEFAAHSETPMTFFT